MNVKLNIQCLIILRMIDKSMFSSLVTTLRAFWNTKYGLSVVLVNTKIYVTGQTLNLGTGYIKGYCYAICLTIQIQNLYQVPKSLVIEFVSVHCLYIFNMLYILTFFTCQKVAFSKWHSKSESEYYKMIPKFISIYHTKLKWA